MNLTDNDVKEVIAIIRRLNNTKGFKKNIEEVNRTLTDVQRVLDIYRNAGALNENLINACLDTITINKKLLNELNQNKRN